MIRASILILALFLPSVGVAENISVYVWDFTTRQGEQTDLTESLTREFEEAITALDSHFTILNGRDPSRFISHRQNVNKIQTLAGASQALLADMKEFQVDQVIFGEVHDDVASGELILTITFETLEGRKVLVKSGAMKRGLQTDRATRVTMAQKIVAALTARTRTINRQTSAGFIFDLVECNRASRTITCSFTVTNNEEDRYLQVYYLPSYGTRLFDDQSNQLVPIQDNTSVTLANQTRNEYEGSKAFLPASIPTPLAIAFDKASTSVTKIVRLDISCWESDHDKKFVVTFRNIQIKEG